MDVLEKNFLPGRRYWLQFCVQSRQSHSTIVYWLTVLNTNVIPNCRNTLSEPNNTNFMQLFRTQQDSTGDVDPEI